MRAHLVSCARDTVSDLRRTLERHRCRCEGRGKAISIEQTQHSGCALVDTVGVVRLVTEIAYRLLQRDPELINGLGATVAVLDVEFGTFFDIHDERERKTRTTRPSVTHV